MRSAFVNSKSFTKPLDDTEYLYIKVVEEYDKLGESSNIMYVYNDGDVEEKNLFTSGYKENQSDFIYLAKVLNEYNDNGYRLIGCSGGTDDDKAYQLYIFEK